MNFKRIIFALFLFFLSALFYILVPSEQPHTVAFRPIFELFAWIPLIFFVLALIVGITAVLPTNGDACPHCGGALSSVKHDRYVPYRTCSTCGKNKAVK